MTSMMRRLMQWFFILLVVMSSPSGMAQGAWPLQHVDKTAGLSNSAINAIFMDSHDHVWFGTWDGLNRYDGSRIFTYKPAPGDSTSISNNIIRNILEDANGQLWIVTHDGLNRYDREKNTFIRYLDALQDFPFVENNLKTSSNTQATLFVSKTGWGVARYNATTDSFDPYLILGENLPEDLNRVITRLEVSGTRLLLVTTSGRYLEVENNQVVVDQMLKDFSPTDFHKFFSLHGQQYFAYQTTDQHLAVLTINESEKTTSSIILPSRQITCLQEDLGRASAFLGTDDGHVYRLFPVEDRFELINMDGFLPTLAEKHLKIFSIRETRQNLLWIGTDGDGIYKYLTKQRSFTALEKGSPANGQLSSSIVRAIYEQGNKLFVGTRGGGLNVIDQQLQKTTVLNRSLGLSDNAVLALKADENKNIWIGLDNAGINMLETETGRILRFPEDFKLDVTPPEFSSVYEILFDSFGDMWLGTSGFGVLRLRISQELNGIYRLKEAEQITSSMAGAITLKSDIIYSIVEEDPNTLWFGARNGGLYRYNSLQKKFTHHIMSGSTLSPSQLSNDDILSLHLDDSRYLWVGTSGGLNRVNLRDYTVSHFLIRDELINNLIHGILQDNYKDLWLSTNDGLVFFQPDSNFHKVYNWYDGLINSEFTDGAYWMADNGSKLYFGGTSGIDIIYPEKIETSIIFPKLTFTEFFLSNVRVLPGDGTDLLSHHIDLQESIILAYDQNFLSFQFTSLDYWHKPRTRYRYYLENFEKGWNYLGSQSSVNLTNVPPGSYTLFVNNTNENGDWNPTPRAIEITIKPPFWATTWAYAFYVLLLIAAQIGIIAIYRERARQKKLSEIDRLKRKHEADMVNYKLEFFTDIAHEFRTHLTMILGPAASLMDKGDKDPLLKRPLTSIYKNALRLQKLIQELIQFRKVELGKETLHTRLVDCVRFVQEIMDPFRQYAAEKEITLSFSSKETPLNAEIDTEKVEKILINLISNALKYTDPQGEVIVGLWQEADRIYFKIKDTGMGILPEDQERIFLRYSETDRKPGGGKKGANSVGIGLSLTKKLIELHQGEITVSSNPSLGTEFIFWLPANLQGTAVSDQDEAQKALLKNVAEHVSSEFYEQDHMDKELINISLDQFEHTVLVVDDNWKILELIKSLLANRYNVITCQEPLKALEIIEHRTIHCVVSDVIMPEMDGYTLCEQIKSDINISHTPVILLTAKGDQEDRISGLKAGADAYIPKPFHPEHLAIRIEKLIKTREILKLRFQSLAGSDSAFDSFGIGSREDDFFRELSAYITDNLGKPDLDAQEIAHHLGMSKTSVYKKTRALTGQTPHSLINQYRLKRAAFLLKNSDHTVSEIIYMTGFNSRSYFYKSFQQLFKCAPSEYVKE